MAFETEETIVKFIQSVRKEVEELIERLRRAEVASRKEVQPRFQNFRILLENALKSQKEFEGKKIGACQTCGYPVDESMEKCPLCNKKLK